MAFNAAFEEFGLPYRWDEELYGILLRTTGGQRRIDGYLAEQGVPEPERRELVSALHRRKTEIMSELVDGGRVDVRPGVARLLAELAGAECALAVATTGSRDWVERLLERLLPGTSFDVIVTGDEVAARKPDPEAFDIAMERLDVSAREAVVVEDSQEGLEAAKAARLPCVVVVNGYTSDHDLASADLVLDGFGEPGEPARVLSDPLRTECAGLLDAATLERVAARARRTPDAC